MVTGGASGIGLAIVRRLVAEGASVLIADVDEAALELAPKKIRVNTVSPGLTDTPLTAGFRDIDGVEAAFMARIPMARCGTPADMAAAALFLASKGAGYITGSNLIEDGGWETTAYPALRPFRDTLLEGP
jgi:NAD(P)-dependent dehydrogenase (short-subunit alcohol dehydrogenase family)